MGEREILEGVVLSYLPLFQRRLQSDSAVMSRQIPSRREPEVKMVALSKRACVSVHVHVTDGFGAYSAASRRQVC